MELILLAYLVTLHIAAAAIFMNPELVPKIKARLKLIKTSNTQLGRMLIYHEAMDPSIEAGASIFLGDSITQSLAVSSVTANAVNFGIGRQTTEEMLTALPHYKSLNRAGRVYILIGINDLLQNKRHGLIERYAKIADHIPSTTPIVWSAVMPTDNRFDLETIKQVNRETEAFCASRPNCTFVNTLPLFTNPNGSVQADNFRDGLHLSPKGYKLWIAGLKQATVAG